MLGESTLKIAGVLCLCKQPKHKEQSQDANGRVIQIDKLTDCSLHGQRIERAMTRVAAARNFGWRASGGHCGKNVSAEVPLDTKVLG